jgi:hypothetical protein
MSADNNISQQSISTLVDITLNKHSEHMNPYDQFLGKKHFYSDTSSLSELDNEYNSFFQDSSSNKKKIFITEKTKKRKEQGDKDEKIKMKQIKNRLAAKKCRENKKKLINNLVDKIKQTEVELQFYKQLTQQTNDVDVYNTVNNFNVINESSFSNITSEEYKIVKIYKDILFHLVPSNIRDYVINFLDLTEVWNSEFIKYRINEFQTL